MKPYEYNQADFINWLQANTMRTDFLEPIARRNNDWKGNLISPLVSSEAAITQTELKKSNGNLAVYNQDYITLIGDNRYNPTRYISPVNETHHREQASLIHRVDSAPNMWDNTAGLLNNYEDGLDRDWHLMMDYVVEVTITDHRPTYNEYSIWDIYGGIHPSSSDNLNGVHHWNTYNYGLGNPSHGLSLSTPTKEAMSQYLATRLIPSNFQVSLMVNWAERDNKYRMSEWMIAGKNYESSIYYPPTPNGLGFKPTVNDALNPWIKEGGNSGNVGWHRHPISLLSTSEFLFNGQVPEFEPVIVAGGAYWDVADGNWTNTMWGKIDLTNYYVLSKGHQFFPGQRGYWVDQEVGFGITNPSENHGIEWVGVVFENHSMHEIKVKITTLNVYAEYQGM